MKAVARFVSLTQALSCWWVSLAAAGAPAAASPQQARTVARVVLLATILPSRRDPPAMRDALNAGLTARHPDALPLAERFAAAGWEQLLGDEIHPNEAGYELIATTLAEELERRAIVSGPNTRR